MNATDGVDKQGPMAAKMASWDAKELLRAPMDVLYREGRLKLTQDGSFLLDIRTFGVCPEYEACRFETPNRDVKFLTKREAAEWIGKHVGWTANCLPAELKEMLGH